MVTRRGQGEFHTTYPWQYKIESLHMPKPGGRSYTADERIYVDRIKALDAKQRSLLRSIKDNEALYRQRFYGDMHSKTIRPKTMDYGSKERAELKKLSDKIDSLATSFSVAKHDKEMLIRYLEQWIMSEDMEHKKKRGK